MPLSSDCPVSTSTEAPAAIDPPACGRCCSIYTSLFRIAAVLVALIGIGLRFYPSASHDRPGFDEILYRIYVGYLDLRGLGGYPAATEKYLEEQRKPETMAELPPTRFLYVFCASTWDAIEFGDEKPVDILKPGAMDRDPIMISLRHVSAFFSALLMLLCGLAAWRMFGRGAGLGVMSLVAFAPLQILMSQHALIDGFFAFWATLSLWLLWENLRQPGQARWLAAYGVSLALMVMTKENAFFVYVALAALTLTNRWTRLGAVTPALLAVSVIGPLVGLAALVALAGGPQHFIEIYQLLVTKAEHLDYAIKTGDGPWYRYLVDLMVVNPVLLCLAIGGVFQLTREDRTRLFLIGFVVVTYAIMCNVRHGMNLRYATIWELPLQALAFGEICRLGAQWFGRWRRCFIMIAVAGLCAYEWHQYEVFFVQGGIYEPAPEDLLRAVKILK